MSKRAFNEAARRLYAAVLAAQFKIASLDEALKLVPAEMPDCWIEVAYALQGQVTESLAPALFEALHLGPDQKGPHSRHRK